jgi:hypothetical protein
MAVEYAICSVCRKLIYDKVVSKHGKDDIVYMEFEKCKIEKFCERCGYKMMQLPKEEGNSVTYQCPKCGECTDSKC